MGRDVAEQGVYGVRPPRDRPGELSGGVLRRGGGLGVDYIHDRLGLREVHAAVQEGALRELPGPRLARAEGEEPPERLREHDRRAVALELRRVLARIRARRAAYRAQAAVERPAVRRRQRAVYELPRRVRAHRPPVRRAEQLVHEPERVRPGDAHYAYRGDAPARGYGGYGISHNLLLSGKKPPKSGALRTYSVYYAFCRPAFAAAAASASSFSLR